MEVADLDLLDPSSTLPASLAPVRVLVWAGPEVLGTVDLPPVRPRDIALIPGLLADAFGTPLRARGALPTGAPTGMTAAELTVVVCTRDRPAMLTECLTSLGRLDPPPAEVLVVDNASTGPESRQAADAAGVRCVSEPAPGLNRARERGWRSAGTALVAYVDDDARAHPGFARAVEAGFLSAQVGAVTGLVAPAELATPAQRLFERQGGMGKGYQRRVYDVRSWPYGVQPYRLGVGTNMAFRTDVLEQLGGFDPRLDVGTPTRGGGDLDMLYRTMLSGYPVVYQPDAVVRHIHRRDWPGLVAQMTDNGVAFAALLAKYERELPGHAGLVQRERRRWHLQRHGRGPLGAVRRRELWLLRLLWAEVQGSRRGRVALAQAGATAAPVPSR